MHLFLTDRLSCPRCGPSFGLILLAQSVRDRRVFEGDLGCPNCRDNYPVRGGFADLRPPPRNTVPAGDWPEAGEKEEEAETEALRIAAALGLTEGPGTLLVVGPASRMNDEVSRRIGGVEVVGIHPALAGVEERDGVSRMQSGPALPFFPSSFQGVLLSGRVDDPLLGEGFRVVAPGCRVVILGSTGEHASWVEQAGHKILLQDEGVLVAVREGVDTQPLVTLRGL